MKNVFKIGCLLLGIAFVFGSCSDDDNSPFEGTDNYITAVTITQAGSVYEAVIAGDSITVTVPYTVSLDGATVDFEHSELAVITPDPATIVNWNSERLFRVTSYNNADRRYIYRVIHSDIYNEGDVVLQTQADVDAFAEGGATVISGNLVIGAYTGTDSVTDLSGLAALKEVKGSIIVNNNYFGTDLSGLDHLEKAGSVKIGTAAEPSRAPLLSMVRFPKLREIKSEFIVNNTNIQWVQAPLLVSIGESLLVFSESLTSVTFPELKSVRMDVQIKGITEGVTDYGSIIKNIEFPVLEQIGGKLYVAKMAALETVDFPLLSSINNITVEKARSLQEWNCPSLESCGAISIIPISRTVDPTPLERLNFNSLKEIEGDLTLSGLGIKELTGISNLEKISGTLNLSFDNELVSWDLVNLKYAGGIAIIGPMNKFAPEIIDVSNVEFGGGGFELRVHKAAVIKGPQIFYGDIKWNISATTVIEGFDNIEGNIDLNVNGTTALPFKEIGGNLIFSGSGTISFPALKEAMGNIEAGGGTNLNFPALTQVEGWLYVNSKALKNFSAPVLKAVGKQLCLALSAAWNVTEIDLSLLETIGLKGPGKKGSESYELEMPVGNIQHFSLPKLTEVRGDIFLDTWADEVESIALPNLKTITGTLNIWNTDEDDSYESLTTLNFASLTTVGKIDIQYNGGLKDYSTFSPLFVNSKLTAEQWVVLNNGYNPSWQDMKDGKYAE